MSKNRETELEKLLDDMQGKHSKRMNALLHTLDDEEFPVAYFKMLEYSAPKLQRREVTVETKETKIVIEHITSEMSREESND